MELFTGFIRDIAGFVVFSGMVRVIAPDRFSRYINVVLGLILISIMFRYITASFDTSAYYDDAPDMGEDTVVTFTGDSSDIEGLYTDALSAHMSKIVEESGFTPVSVDFSVEGDVDDEMFGTIYSVNVVIREREKPFIRVEGKNEGVAALKKIISDFYNLSADNIYIEVYR